jgi:hypothetical protein
VDEEQRNAVFALALYYVKALGFEYLSDVGVHPLGTKGDPTQRVNKQTNKSAATAVNPAAGGFSHIVPFELGATNLRGGDQIVIDEVRGTADTIKAGNVYEIKGTYKLASQSKAMLAAFVTDYGADPRAKQRRGVPYQKIQTTIVERGEGKFSLILYIEYEGKPHLSFYPESGGDGLGGVYFGTGESVLRKGWWEDSRKGSEKETSTQPKPAADAAPTPETQPTPDKQQLQNNP